MTVLNLNGDEDRLFYIHTINFMKDLKIYSGAKGVEAFLRRHRDINKYLFNHLRNDAKNLDSEVLKYLH